MTDTNTDQEPEDIAKLRERANSAKKLERENAMLRAGVDLDSKTGQMFAKAYDGELTTEAITAEAAEVGAMRKAAEPSPEPVTDTASSDEVADIEQMQAISSNSTTSDGVADRPPYELAREAYEASRKAGEPQEWAEAAALSQIMAAANAGDERVLVKSRSEGNVQ